jgi:hypothetical protein
MMFPPGWRGIQLGTLNPYCLVKLEQGGGASYEAKQTESSTGIIARLKQRNILRSHNRIRYLIMYDKPAVVRIVVLSNLLPGIIYH